MRKAGAKDYKSYSKKILSICNNKPVSLEVFADEYSEMKKQAIQINTWAKNVYVKVPVANSKGIFMGKIIKELNNEGISSLKFRVRYHHLLTRPLIFAIMSIIAGFFAINHIRNQKAFIMIFLGVLTGVGLYIFDNIAVTLGSAGLISVISASWIMAMIYLSIAILLIFYKEKF